MNRHDLTQALEAEKAKLEAELATIAVHEPESEGHDQWLTTAPAEEVEIRDEMADRFETIAESQATNVTLRERLLEVDRALTKMTDDSYGACEICDQIIEIDRLEANPAARTCKTHIDINLPP